MGTRNPRPGVRTDADLAIEAALTIGMVFHLPIRQAEGFLRSLVQLLEIKLPIPDHTTLSRRLQKFGPIKFRRLASDLTGRRAADCARVPALIEQIDEPVASLSADGAYDTAAVYEAA